MDQPMETLIHADIFFFITAIAVVVLTVAVLIALYYAIHLLRDMREVAGRLKRMSVELESDFQDARKSVKGEVAKIRALFDVMLSFGKRFVKPPRQTRARSASKAAETAASEE